MVLTLRLFVAKKNWRSLHTVVFKVSRDLLSDIFSRPVTAS